MAVDDLLTVADRVALLVNALANERDHEPVVRIFTDAGAMPLLSESDPDDPDRLFGLCDLGLGCPELGYVSLKEIADCAAHSACPLSAICTSSLRRRCRRMLMRRV